MIACERALAKVQGDLGIIPGDQAQAIFRDLDGIVIDPEELAAGTAADGVPVPALVRALRESLPAEAAQWLHWGATSQDIIDTGQILGLRECLNVLVSRLGALIDALQQRSEEYSGTLMAGRTRAQVSTPITFGLRIAQWARPLIGLENGIEALKSDLLRVQFGGASGANTAIAPHGPSVAAALAHELGLQTAPPWHTDRHSVARLAGWLVEMSSALAKVARDLVLLSRSEIAEVTLRGGGASSTMPQKSNPVGPESVLSLCDIAVAAGGGLQMAGGHAEERDGARWAVEWVLLPQLLLASGAALRRTLDTVSGMTADADRMRSNLAGQPGALAEQASFLLAQQMPRAEAQKRVKHVLSEVKSMQELVKSIAALDPEYAERLQPEAVVEPSRIVCTEIFSARLAGPTGDR